MIGEVLFRRVSLLGLLNWMNDETYLKIKYQLKNGRPLNLDNPKTFNEKLQWLKLHDRNPAYTTMVDKYAVKEYVSSIIGPQYIIPTIGIYDRFDQIDFSVLPDSFVMKCTHDSGGLVLVKDRQTTDLNEARKKIEKSLRYNYFYAGREWPYKNVKPRIIIEEFLKDDSGENGRDGLFDYKIFCFDGKAKLIQVDIDRFINHRRNLYDTDWNYIDAMIEYPTDPNYTVKKPAVLDEMLSIASSLSKGIPFVRVDLYCIQNHIYFGELTLYHGSGIETFQPESFGEELGSYIKLDKAEVS